ncbi:MAG: DUF3494 domain-containing protein [Hyperionvirus sp.]|uniref:DUF3494 domain-containing protein n=1 Tax=Hyperionvirus sp. TaxID=2487770 RepID=A0A3G5ABD3_9VIRU|nr:MAG: DUF3494 domain-containing protein [Hyperionvirus sp.]
MIVPLGSAAAFAVLAKTTVTNDGMIALITGDLGVSPGSGITGFPPGVVVGSIHDNDAVAAQAQLDLTTAYNEAAELTPTSPTDFTGDIGGLTFGPGVYKASSSVGITGTVILDGHGNPNAGFVFQIGSTLVTASDNSRVLLINGATCNNVFWQVGSAATLNSGAIFVGNILAADLISTSGTGANVTGRLLSMTAAVTLGGTSGTNFVNSTACAAVVCFKRGTNILTAKGYVPVENLAVGNYAMTLIRNKKIPKKITWIGKFTLTNLSSEAKPICIRKNAIAENVPEKDVYVSPKHGIFLNGSLVEAKLLVNHGTIFRAFFESVEYYHVELDKHSILLADGMPVESFLDTGSRDIFDNTPLKYPFKTWKRDGCARLIETEKEAEPIKKILEERSKSLGYNSLVAEAR